MVRVALRGLARMITCLDCGQRVQQVACFSLGKSTVSKFFYFWVMPRIPIKDNMLLCLYSDQKKNVPANHRTIKPMIFGGLPPSPPKKNWYHHGFWLRKAAYHAWVRLACWLLCKCSSGSNEQAPVKNESSLTHTSIDLISSFLGS